VRSSWGRQITYSLFGESHGPGIGITIHHLPAGFEPDLESIRAMLDRRRPGTGTHSTPRQEKDAYEFLSGFFNGRLTGAPLTVLFRNHDTRSQDYKALGTVPRPSHADYAAHVKYSSFNDYRGGGHFSGRLTAPLVFAGALAAQLLARQGVCIVGHLVRIGSVEAPSLDPLGKGIDKALLGTIGSRALPVARPESLEPMLAEIEAARMAGDSVGGTVEIVAVGVPAGGGEPLFEAVESTLAQLVFAIPGVKALEFGAGKDFAHLTGSQANDGWTATQKGIEALTNRSGGINGGITNGMPLCFRVTFRPTPSIALEQHSVNLETGSDELLAIRGRHDPCIVPRACPVVEAVTAMALLEAMLDQQIQRQEDWK